MNYLIYPVWFIAVCFGGVIDALMWGKKENDPKWLQDWTDFFWLTSYNVIVPALFIGLGFAFAHSFYPLELFIIKNIFIAFGMSIFWDLIFTRIERGVWIDDIPKWTYWKALNFNISFTKAEMITFNIIRVLFLLISIAL